MIDKSKRYIRPVLPLEEVPVLKGKRLNFNSVAEMVMVRAQEIPDSAYALYYDQVVTFGQVNERANRVANYLKTKGVKKGDIVSVMVLNAPEIFYTLFGAQKLGAVGGAINYMLKAPEIAYVLEDSKPKVAFVGSEYMNEFAAGWKMAKHKPAVVEVVTGVDHGMNIAERNLKDILSAYPADECFVDQAPEDPFLLLYSSGTTGSPKGILLSNKNELCICRDLASLGGYQPGGTALVVLPMFHTNPLCVYTYPFFYVGLTLCIRKSFSPVDFWPSIMDNGVTVVMGVPAMYAYVLNKIDPRTIDHSRLKLTRVASGAAPLPIDIVKGFKEKFNVDITDGYGLTEGCGVTLTSFGVPENRNSIGMALPSQEVEIMDDENRILPYGQKGEICIKGDAVMIGYLNKPEATAETIKDGWMHTGDLGHMDEMGYLYISGRTKEMINRGGENIYPREIEIPLEKHPKIEEVAVVGIPDPALGERVKAFIVLREPGGMTPDEVKEYLQDRIAKYKIPETVEFLERLPRNPTGKVLKQELRNRTG